MQVLDSIDIFGNDEPAGCPSIVRPPPEAGASARHRRRIAKLARLVARWWQSIPPDARRPFYRSDELSSGIGAPMSALGPALRAMGWYPAQVRLLGVSTSVWVVPGSDSPKQEPGRPADAPRDAQGRYSQG